MAHPDERVEASVPMPDPDVDQEQGTDDPISFPFQDWLSAHAGRPVWAAGFTLILVQATVRAWVKFGGWFTGDDFSFLGRAFTMPTWSTQYLLEGWNGHFMPGAFIQVKVLETLWPFDYTPVALFDLVLQAVISLLVLRLLVELFGPRFEVLIPFTFFVLTPMTLPAFLWWAAAVNQLWGQLAMVLMLLAHLRYHRTGLLRWGLAGVAAMVGGLLFSEKLLLMAPVMAAFTFLWFTPGPPLRRLRLALRTNAWLWTAYAFVVVTYLVYYRLAVPAPLGKPDPFIVTVQTIGTGLVQAVIPAVFGGPFTWLQINIGGIAQPPLAVVVGMTLLAAMIVWVSVWRNARAVFGWWVVGGYLVINAAILGATRATYVGPNIGAEYRYHTDLAMIIAIFGTMAFLPLVGPVRHGTYQRLRPRHPGVAAWHLGPGIVGAVVCALAVGSITSTLTYDPFWRSNTKKTFYGNVERSIASVDHPITIADFPAEFLTYTESWRLFSAYVPQPTFMTRGTSAPVVFLPDPEGNLRAGTVEGFHSAPGPEANCGWRVAQNQVTVPLDAQTMAWLWTVRMSYIATYANDITVTAGTITSQVHLEPGPNTVYFLAEGDIDRVEISGLVFGSMCTDDIEVGFLSPQAGSTPRSVDGTP